MDGSHLCDQDFLTRTRSVPSPACGGGLGWGLSPRRQWREKAQESPISPQPPSWRFRLCKHLNQPEAFAHQHHVFAKLALPAEISAVCLAPIFEAAVAFAFIV